MKPSGILLVVFCSMLFLLVGCKQEIDITNIQNSESTILDRISISDIPELYKTELTHIDYPQYDKTTFDDSMGVRIFKFKNIEPRECYALKNEKENSQAKETLFAECIESLAIISGNYSLCKLTYNQTYLIAPENCLMNFAFRRNNVASCYLIERPDDLTEDRDEGDWGGFTACIYQVIISNPTEEGCKLLARTISGSNGLAESCFSKLTTG